MWQPYLNEKRVVIGYTEMKDFGGCDQKCLAHYAFFVTYNVTNVFHSAIKAAKGFWGFSPLQTFKHYLGRIKKL